MAAALADAGGTHRPIAARDDHLSTGCEEPAYLNFDGSRLLRLA